MIFQPMMAKYVKHNHTTVRGGGILSILPYPINLDPVHHTPSFIGNQCQVPEALPLLRSLSFPAVSWRSSHGVEIRVHLN